MQSVPDIPRIYTGIAEILACYIYCLLYPRKPGVLRSLLHLLFGVTLQCAFLVVTDNVPLFFWHVCMVAAFAMMYVFLRVHCGLDPVSLIYITIRAVILAEFAASVEWQLHVDLRIGLREEPWAAVLLLILVYLVIFSLAYLLEKRLRLQEERPVFAWSETAAAGLIGIAIFAFSNMGFLAIRFVPEIRMIDVFSNRTLVDLGGLAVLYAYQFRTRELQAQKELSTLSTALQSQYESYRGYQETIELINIKYHDLKHHAMLLRAEMDPQKRNAYLDELEQELREFRPETRTGNPVLDTILTGKSVKMRKNRIQFTCVADGKLLGMMHVTDICAIFGNALDNAIEHVAQIEDVQKRLISMNIARKKDFLVIQISNYCDTQVQMENNLPVTTKKDKNLHGYGVRSIAYTVRKYGGTVTFGEKDHFFTVRILIPLEKQEQLVTESEPFVTEKD